MIYEIRTYKLKPGHVARYETGFADGLATREQYSKLAAFWHTEIGPLNEVIHVWPYENLEHRAEVREAAAADTSGKWPPKNEDTVLSMHSEIVVPAPFMRPLLGERHALGGIYEMRIYDYQPGSTLKVLDRWGQAVPGREALSPLAFAGFSELGTLNRWFHIWPYQNLSDRDRIRNEAVKRKVWPPNTGEWLVKMQNKLMVPASFSPLQ